MLKILTVATLTTVSLFALHTAELNLNDKDLEVGVKFDMGQFNDNVEPNTMFVGGKFMDADASHSDDTPLELEQYAEINFLMMREIEGKGIKIGMGAKLNYTKDYSTLPLGLELTYKVPGVELMPMHLNASVYHAPEVLSFIDANSYFEYRVSVDLELIENGFLTVGYRSMNTNYQTVVDDLNYNATGYFGFKISF